MSSLVSLTVFFLDGTKVTFRYPRQSGTDPATIAATVKKAIDADKLLIEADGDLLVIPIKSVKYIQLSPAPPHLARGRPAPGARAGVIRKRRRGDPSDPRVWLGGGTRSGSRR